MKIVHLCLANFYVEGFGYQENLIPKYNKKDGHEVTIIASRFTYNKNNGAPDLTQPGEYINADGIKVIRIDYKYKFFKKISKRLRIYCNTYEVLKKEKPDIIFIHGTQFWDIRDAIKYKINCPDVKIFADNHADYINSARNILSKYVLHKIIWKSGIEKLMSYCEKIFGVTPIRCDFLINMYNVPKEKVELLVMGANSEKIDFCCKDEIRSKIRRELDIGDNDFVLITGGKIDRRKNIHNLIDAVNKIGNYNIKLIVFGTVTDEMKNIIEDISLTPFIRNVGWIHADDVYKYYIASDLAIFPGTHSVLWEQAVGTGIPCIFKKWEGMTHVDVGGNCKFIYDGSVKEIEDMINSIYSNSKEYKKMKMVALERGVPYFSYEEISRRAIGGNK